MSEDKLLPCPNCGSLALGRLQGVDNITYELFNRVYCKDCGLMGPEVYAGEGAATDDWNAWPRKMQRPPVEYTL